MSSNGNYPPGAQHDPAAPWNEGSETKRVTVSVTYSKEFVLEVPKGCTPKELDDFVRRAIITPKEIADRMADKFGGLKGIYGGWEEDDFAVAE